MEDCMGAVRARPRPQVCARGIQEKRHQLSMFESQLDNDLREYYEVLISIGLRHIQIGSFSAYTNIQMYHPAEVIYIVHFFEHTRNECRFSSPPSAPLTPQLALRSLQTTMNRKPEAKKLFVSWPPRPEERRGKGRQSIRRRLRGRPGDGRYIYHGVNCILSLVVAV
jgi:hypothetical protein